MIQLTFQGWTGSSKGAWNKKSNVLEAKKMASASGLITLEASVTANSLAGNDVLSAEVDAGRAINLAGTLLLQDDQDELTGLSAIGVGIRNTGVIDMGQDDDKIIAFGKERGLFNSGSILMGDGNDRVDIRRGALTGKGLIDLGNGDDTTAAFGKHSIEAGRGRDTMLLRRGRYDIFISDCGCNLVIAGRGTLLAVDDMERIGSSLSGNTVGLREGTLQISGDGGVSYI